MVLRLHQHNIGYMADGFYRPKGRLILYALLTRSSAAIFLLHEQLSANKLIH